MRDALEWVECWGWKGWGGLEGLQGLEETGELLSEGGGQEEDAHICQLCFEKV